MGAEYKPKYLCDLHCHTTRSDGNDSPTELIEKAARIGMRVVAITDHDVIPPAAIQANGEDVEIRAFARGLGVEVLPGCEISCDTQVEDVHILCFGCDWKDPYFSELERTVQESKIEAYRALTKALQAYGMDVGWEEVLDNAGTPRQPSDVQKKHIFELMARKGYFPSWQEAKLAVKASPAFSIKREKPDPVEVLNAVHNAGGIALLAHPFLIDGKAAGGRERYIERLIEAGLDGIEATYPYRKTSFGGSESDEEIERYIRTYYASLKILSGGSDYHADAKKGVGNPREIGECGVTPEYFWGNPVLAGLI